MSIGFNQSYPVDQFTPFFPEQYAFHYFYAF